MTTMLSKFGRAVFSTLLASLFVVMAGLAAPAAQAVETSFDNDYYSNIFSGRLEAADEFDSARLSAIEDCLPEELTLQNEDTSNRVARALGEMGNDQLERAFNLDDDPKLSDAEKDFQRCLNRKGIRFESPVQ